MIPIKFLIRIILFKSLSSLGLGFVQIWPFGFGICPGLTRLSGVWDYGHPNLVFQFWLWVWVGAFKI
jgi:hypothetical protein